MILERKHVYKITRDGIYLGTLPYVFSEFNYSQDINTGSAETIIEVGQGLDTAHEDVLNIETESGETLTTELGEVITTERSFENIGNKDSGRLIASGNDVDIYEYSDDDPNGVLVFSGYISGWSNEVGAEDRTTITVISHGKDLNDYIDSDDVYALEVSNAATSSYYDFAPAGFTPYHTSVSGKVVTKVAQSFTGYSFNLKRIAVTVGKGTNGYINTDNKLKITLELYEGAIGSGTFLASDYINTDIDYPTSIGTYFIFDIPITLSASKTYYFVLTAPSYAYVYTSGNTFASGNADIYVDTLGWQNVTGVDLAFQLLSGYATGAVTYTSVSPYGLAYYSMYYSYKGRVFMSSTTSPLPDTLNYKFKNATVLEIINKAIELSPAGWYWYVDPSNQELFFLDSADSPEHYFHLHKHISGIKISSTIENIKNVVYFSGAPTAGVNLYDLYTDVDSLRINKRGLARITDNRVTTSTNSAILSNSLMDEQSIEEFSTDITILAIDYDIKTIKLGQIVGFRGFGSFIDNLALQVRSITRGADYIRLTLGKAPMKSSDYVNDIKKQLQDEQTLANPDII